MFGIQLWLVVAAVLTIGILTFAGLRMRDRTWLYRTLTALGLLCLVWGILPIFGGGGMNQFLVVGAIAAFGFLILSESVADSARE